MMTATISIAQRLPEKAQKLLNAQYAISAFYVDSVDEDKVVENAIIGMLEKLDPHSSYSDAKETADMEEPLQGEFSGIGIQFNLKQDTLYVVQTIAGGPSERLGMRAGDRIITVNDTLIAGTKKTNADIRKMLRGKKGSKVVVQVKRGNSNELITFRITRDNIPLYSIDASYMLDKKTGYVRISRFGAKTHEEMMDALKDLEKQGMKQVIIDLSDNGGGYLNAAIDMCNEFLDRGQLIVYTEGNQSSRNDATAKGNGKYKDLKMVIITNQYSASAAEIFSGAMQDWDRAVIVGRRTFGKGLVQRPFKFQDGSMMRLTTARYYTPSGRCIQKPYTKGDKKAYEEDLLERGKDGEYFSIDSIQFNDTIRYYTHNNHRTIYGSGGIMPDVFVPFDTTEYTLYYRKLSAKGIINQYVIDYVDKNRNELTKKYPDVYTFDKKFTMSDDEMKRLITMGENDSIKHDEKEYQLSENLLKCVTKALIARDLYKDRSAYDIVYNHRDREVQEALSVINDDKRYNELLLHGNPEYERLASKRLKK